MLSIMNRIGANVFVRAMLLVAAMSVVCLATSVDVCAKEQRRIHEQKGDGDGVAGIKDAPETQLQDWTQLPAVNKATTLSVETTEAMFRPPIWIWFSAIGRLHAAYWSH